MHTKHYEGRCNIVLSSLVAILFQSQMEGITVDEFNLASRISTMIGKTFTVHDDTNRQQLFVKNWTSAQANTSFDGTRRRCERGQC